MAVRLPIDWDGVITDLVVPFADWLATGTISASTVIAFDEALSGTAFTLVWDKFVDLETGVAMDQAGSVISDRGAGLYYLSALVRAGGAIFIVYPDTSPAEKVSGLLLNPAAASIDAPTLRAALGMASADLDQQLGDILTAAQSVGSQGDVLFTWTEYASGHDGDPAYALPDVMVAAYSNNLATGTPVDTKYTDELGQAKLYLDAGTYYLFRRKAGRTFSNPATIVVG